MKRRVLLKGAAALGVAAIGGPAFAENWPSRPIRIVCPYPPGGIVDILARLIGDELGRSLGQPVII